MSDLLTSDEILTYLREVASILGDSGPPKVVIMVGGALMAMHGLRESTRDVDSVRPVDGELAAAVAEVAKRHGLEPGWLNTSAMGYRPTTLTEDECELLIDAPRLRVFEAPLRYVFLMKLRSDRSRDHGDLPSIWPHAGFASAQEAVDEYRRAYPEAPDDENLVSYVDGIRAKAQ